MCRSTLCALLLVLAGCGTSLAPGADGGASDGDVVAPQPDGSAAPDGAGVPDGSVASDAGDAPPERSCSSVFRFQPAASLNVIAVGLGGEWNGFDPTQTPMAGPDTNGAYTATVDLAPGAYAYKLVVTEPGGAKEWLLDPGTPYTKYVGGIENSVREVDDCRLPELRFGKLDRTPDGTIHGEVQYVDGADGAGLLPESVEALLDGAPAPGLVARPSGLFTVDGTQLARGKHRLVFRAGDRAGHAARELLVPFWIEAQPFDFRDGVMYFAFTDRFRDGAPDNDAATDGTDARANYEGGDFAGIQQAIESGWFEQLGVRTLWLSPPNANPDHAELGTGGHSYTGYHGYWPSSGREVQKRFGDLAALKALVAAAHARGLRVIVDLVLNHVHRDSPYFAAHQNDGWFTPLTVNGETCTCQDGGCGDWTAHALTCWFQPYMPDLDYQNWDALTTMIDDALYWAREADVDGFRVDAVKHFLLAATVRLRSKLHDELEHAQPLFYLVGETFDGDRQKIASYLGPHALHAQFDFPIYFTLRSTLADDAGSLRDLEAAVHASEAAFGDAPMSPFLGNHDVPRFLSQAGGQLTGDPSGQAWSAPPEAPSDETAYRKLRLAQTFVLTSPGVPLIYYGDEYGQPGAGDPDNRRFMKWSGYSAFEQATLEHVRALGAARAALPALRRGNRITMWIDDQLYVYARVLGKEVAVVAINRDANPRTVSVPVAPGVPLTDGTVLADRLGGAAVTVQGGALALTLAGRSSAVLAP